MDSKNGFNLLNLVPLLNLLNGVDISKLFTVLSSIQNTNYMKDTYSQNTCSENDCQEEDEKDFLNSILDELESSTKNMRGDCDKGCHKGKDNSELVNALKIISAADKESVLSALSEIINGN